METVAYGLCSKRYLMPLAHTRHQVWVCPPAPFPVPHCPLWRAREAAKDSCPVHLQVHACFAVGGVPQSVTKGTYAASAGLHMHFLQSAREPTPGWLWRVHVRLQPSHTCTLHSWLGKPSLASCKGCMCMPPILCRVHEISGILWRPNVFLPGGDLWDSP